MTGRFELKKKNRNDESLGKRNAWHYTCTVGLYLKANYLRIHCSKLDYKFQLSFYLKNLIVMGLSPSLFLKCSYNFGQFESRYHKVVFRSLCMGTNIEFANSSV